MLRRMVLVVALASSSGCSFALVNGPPANHRDLPYFDCTSSRLGPGLDTVWTVLQTLNLLTAVGKTDDEWDAMFGGDPPFSRGAAIGLYTGLAALGGAGMYFGFTRTSRCRSAKGELMLRMQQQPAGGAMPGTWPPPAPTPAEPAPAEPAPTEPTPAEPAPPLPPPIPPSMM